VFQTNSREVEAGGSISTDTYEPSFQTNSREVEAPLPVAADTLRQCFRRTLVRLKRSVIYPSAWCRWFQTNSREVEAKTDGGTAAETNEFQTNSREVEAVAGMIYSATARVSDELS